MPDGIADFGGMGSLRKLRQIIFERGNRLFVIGDIKVSGANRKKSRLQLRREFGFDQQSIKVRRGLGVITGLKLRHALRVELGEIGRSACGRRRLLRQSCRS